jgi:hypothetical protein
MSSADAKRLAAPAAFLLAVTIAVFVARAGLRHGSGATTTDAIPPPPRPRRVVTATTRAKPRPNVSRFYTVVAGDTFAVIASKTGVSTARIQQLNPNVRSTALFVGQKLRVR